MKHPSKGDGQICVAFAMYPKKEHVWNRTENLYTCTSVVWITTYNVFLRSFLDLPFLTNTMVATAEGKPLLGLQPELVLTTVFVGKISTRLPCALLSISVNKSNTGFHRIGW